MTLATATFIDLPRLIAEAARRRLAIPGVFGVFYYRSANPKTLKILGDFMPVPAAGLAAEYRVAEFHIWPATVPMPPPNMPAARAAETDTTVVTDQPHREDRNRDRDQRGGERDEEPEEGERSHQLRGRRGGLAEDRDDGRQPHPQNVGQQQDAERDRDGGGGLVDPEEEQVERRADDGREDGAAQPAHGRAQPGTTEPGGQQDDEGHEQQRPEHHAAAEEQVWQGRQEGHHTSLTGDGSG